MWLGGVVMLVQIVNGMIISRTALLLSIYGWRQYFLYIPLAFVIGECFARDDLLRLAKDTLLVSIPIAWLSILQASAHANSVLNAGLADNPANIFAPSGVALGFVRTSGTFSSNAGQALFIGSMMAMLLWVWILPAERRPLKGTALLGVSLGVLTNLAVSGQRMAFLLALAIVTSALAAAALLQREFSRRSLVTTLALITAGLIVAPLVFPRQLHALAVRATGPGVDVGIDVEGLVERTLNDFSHFTQFLPDSPWLGYGLGVSENGVGRMDIAAPVSAEDDLSRNIIELGPMLGIAFITFRVSLVLWLVAGAIKSARRSCDPVSFLLLGFIGPILLYGQHGQGTINGYAWLFAGFCIVANNPVGEPLA